MSKFYEVIEYLERTNFTSEEKDKLLAAIQKESTEYKVWVKRVVDMMARINMFINDTDQIEIKHRLVDTKGQLPTYEATLIIKVNPSTFIKDTLARLEEILSDAKCIICDSVPTYPTYTNHCCVSLSDTANDLVYWQSPREGRKGWCEYVPTGYRRYLTADIDKYDHIIFTLQYN